MHELPDCLTTWPDRTKSSRSWSATGRLMWTLLGVDLLGVLVDLRARTDGATNWRDNWRFAGRLYIEVHTVSRHNRL